MTVSRIYIITPKAVEQPARPRLARLVRATNAAQALRHVANDMQVTVASQDDLVRQLSAGVVVEDARSE